MQAYLVLLAYERELRFFRLADGEYVLVEPDEYRCVSQPGFARVLVSVRLVLGGAGGGVDSTGGGGYRISGAQGICRHAGGWVASIRSRLLPGPKRNCLDELFTSLRK